MRGAPRTCTWAQSPTLRLRRSHGAMACADGVLVAFVHGGLQNIIEATRRGTVVL